MPKVEDIKILALDFNFDELGEAYREHTDAIKALLPDKTRYKIGFFIRDTNTATANAIRRVLLVELKTRCLDFNIKDVITDEPHIILEELHDRVSFIPLNQNIPLDTEFKVEYTNTHEELAFVHTGDMVQIGGSKRLAELPFSKTGRIAQLRIGHKLKIDHITVIEGYGYEHAKFIITNNFKYRVADYISATFVNSVGFMEENYVKTTELMALAKKLKVDMPDLTRVTKVPRIMVVPDKKYLKLVSPKYKERITNVDYYLENPAPLPIMENGRDNRNAFLPTYTSVQARPHEYYIEFKLHGNIEAKEAMRRACDNLIQRLGSFSRKNVEEESGILQIQSVSVEGVVHTEFNIRGEDHTIGELLHHKIFELDPRIPLVKKRVEHALNRTIVLELIHTEPEKIFFNAVEACIKDIAEIKSYFEEGATTSPAMAKSAPGKQEAEKKEKTTPKKKAVKGKDEVDED